MNRWTEDNKDTDIPAIRPGGSNDQGQREYLWKYADAHVKSASFVKCRNIGIAYSLPKDLIKKWNLQNVKGAGKIILFFRLCLRDDRSFNKWR